MSASIESIATAISRHQFEDAYPFLADNIRWNMVGAEPLIGREAVREALAESAKELAGVETSFDQFNVRVAEHSVVIESVVTYSDGGEEGSVVASCDIYDFANGALTAITSYNIEITSAS